ncbi:MAG TPA: Gfo/Idh/MocA family oxidoreductase [Bryobacteraceae bacterium]|nr:Gfo/Idh/MocA family oxidoreductase [Bryobacteraceae bacterium]
MTRRTFIASSAVTAVSYARIIGANDRLRIGVIGCGSQATGHMRTLVKMRESDNCEVPAVCDVYDKRADEAAKLTAGKVVKDYRRVLDDKGIDYVLIATPEHWHYQMIIDAASAGKHIYCEKPMTHTAAQSKKVVEKIHQSGVKMQVGVQGMSDDSYKTAHKFVQDGTLGKVVLAQIDYSRNYKDDFWVNRVDADAQPGVNLDWKAWLGPAPKRPFDAERFFSWRRYWDYSSGIASDLFIHRVTRIIKALDLKFPVFGSGAGGKFEFATSRAEIPDTLNILLDYPGGPTVQLISSMANDTKVEHLLRGHKATLEFTPTGFTIRPQGRQADAKEIVHQKTGAEVLDLHHRNLMNAIRKNEPLKCDATLGYYGVVACEMGVASYRKRKYMKWDAARERIVPA